MQKLAQAAQDSWQGRATGPELLRPAQFQPQRRSVKALCDSPVTSNYWNFQLQHAYREGKEEDICVLCRTGTAGVNWHGWCD